MGQRARARSASRRVPSALLPPGTLCSAGPARRPHRASQRQQRQQRRRRTHGAVTSSRTRAAAARAGPSRRPARSKAPTSWRRASCVRSRKTAAGRLLGQAGRPRLQRWPDGLRLQVHPRQQGHRPRADTRTSATIFRCWTQAENTRGRDDRRLRRRVASEEAQLARPYVAPPRASLGGDLALLPALRACSPPCGTKLDLAQLLAQLLGLFSSSASLKASDARPISAARSALEAILLFWSSLSWIVPPSPRAPRSL